MYKTIIGVAVVFVALPLQAQAAVIFSEIAWMGTTADANDEWIEIYNFSSEVTNINGWTISDGDSLNIDLAGVMPPHGVFMLERTDDTSAPGVDAAVIYTGALGNSGATLTIKDASGNAVGDPLVGGTDWVNIGGDNESKYTAQFTTQGQWVTGPPTPGLPNVEEEELPPGSDEDNSNDDGEEKSSTRSVSSKSGGKTEPLILPGVTLRLTLDAPITAYVHQPVQMALEPSGVGDVIMDSLNYSWNFGDLTTKTGKEVSHAYEYPGTYVVYVEAEYKRQHASVRREITVLPVSFSLTTNRNGDLQINNDSPYEVDLSGYKVRGEETVALPANTIIVSKGTLTVPSELLGGTAAWLMDQESMVVASTIPSSHLVALESSPEPIVAAKPPPAIVQQVSPIVPEPKVETSQFSFSNVTAPVSTSTALVKTGANNQPLTAAAVDSQTNSDLPINWPLIGLLGIVSLGIFSLAAGKQKTQR